MSGTAARRQRLWILALVGTAAMAIIAVFAVGYWDVALALYRARQLESAETQAEAAPQLDLLWAESLRHRARQAVVDALGPERPRLTLWTFARLESQADATSSFATLLAKRLERDEELLGMWCHYLRWRQGPGFFHCLDEMGPAEVVDPGGAMVCVTMMDRSTLFDTPRQGSQVTASFRFRVSDSRSHLKTLAIAWFVGMAPVPGLDADIEQKLKDWLCAYAPFRRETAFDPALGRCKRAEAQPSVTPFGARGFPLPAVPFPDWKGEVPSVADLDPSAPTSQFLLPPGTLIDTNWRAAEIDPGSPVRRGR